MRTPDDTCLLCKSAKATKTGSHFIPQALISSAIGGRNKEEAWTVDAANLEAKVHFGRGNLKNTSPDITPNPHVMDYIFCPLCEEKLGKLEETAIPFLNEKIRNEKYKQLFSIKSQGNITMYSTSKLDSSVFFAFTTSLIWRMCLEGKLNDGIDTLPETILEEFRNLIYCFIYGLDLNNNKLLSFIRGYTILTYPIDPSEENKNVINPYNQVLNPDIYMINEYAVLVHRIDTPCTDTSTFANNTALTNTILDEEYINNPNVPFKVTFITKKAWENFRTKYFTREARRGIANKLKEFLSIFL